MGLHINALILFSPIVVMIFSIVLCILFAKYKTVFTDYKRMDDNYIDAIVYGFAIGGFIAHILVIILLLL